MRAPITAKDLGRAGKFTLADGTVARGNLVYVSVEKGRAEVKDHRGTYKLMLSRIAEVEWGAQQ